MRRMISRRREERGAIGILVGILFAGGVFLGCVALTVDYGHLNANHSQLQSSADAAATGAAQQCASTGTCPSAASLDSISQQNDNSQAPSHVSAMCGSLNGTPFGTCPTNDNGNITTCPDFTPPMSYVQVLTQKGTHFSFADNGKGGDDTGQACAAVEWGPPKSILSPIPVTIGMCEWWAETSNGTDFSSTTDIAIAIDANKTCGGAPGGFGWLDFDGACQAVISVGDNAGSNPGNGKGHDCDQEMSPLVGSVVYLPIYDSTSGGGNNATYHIKGLAAFHLDGVKSPSFKYTGTAPNNTSSPKCPGNACLWGYFTKALIPVGPVDSDCGAAAPSCDLGLETIQPIG